MCTSDRRFKKHTVIVTVNLLSALTAVTEDIALFIKDTGKRKYGDLM